MPVLVRLPTHTHTWSTLVTILVQRLALVHLTPFLSAGLAVTASVRVNGPSGIIIKKLVEASSIFTNFLVQR